MSPYNCLFFIRCVHDTSTAWKDIPLYLGTLLSVPVLVPKHVMWQHQLSRGSMDLVSIVLSYKSVRLYDEVTRSVGFICRFTSFFTSTISGLTFYCNGIDARVHIFEEYLII